MKKTSANVTIYDVARESGVSYATVSRALNGHADVGAETRKRIIEVSKRLNYRPRAIARGLTKSKSWLMGVAYSGEFDNPFFGKLLSRAKEILEPAGYELLFFHSPQVEESFDLVARARYRQIDGLLLAGGIQKNSSIQSLETLDVPIVSINFHVAMRSSAILSTHFFGATQAMKHLWSLQHRRIGMVTGDLDITSGVYRYRAYTEFLKLKGAAITTKWVVNASFGWTSRESTYDMVRRVMESSERPTAWLCSDDMMAIGAMEACRDLGISVPEEVSVVGFDDIEAAQIVDPQLTTVSQNTEQVGRQSARELLRLVENPDQEGTSIAVPTKLVLRESTGPSPSATDQDEGGA